MHKLQSNAMTTMMYTLFALLAFAANSVLCRLALGPNSIDANSFTIIRLISGAAVLWLMVNLSTGPTEPKSKSTPHLPPLMLFIYAATFSFAYLKLDAGIGALVLFGSVQITMMLASLCLGDRFKTRQYAGLLLAFGGLGYLVWPPQETTQTELIHAQVSILGFTLMAISGVAWGAYTLLGKNSGDPLQDTASNFLKSLPYTVLLLAIFLLKPAHISAWGITLAVITGAITSGLGYAIWYRALPHLARIHAGVLQLTVPFLAALGGIFFLGEAITQKLMVSLAVVSVGIFLVIYSQEKRTKH